MRISDWSSDVCSSDLPPAAAARAADPGGDRVPARTGRAAGVAAAPLSASPQARGGPDVGYAGVLAQSAASSAGTPFPIRGDFSGARLPFSPKWQSSLSADYSLPLGGVNLTMGTTISSQSTSLGVQIGRASCRDRVCQSL